MGLQGFGASPLWMKSRLGLGGREGDKKMRGSQRRGRKFPDAHSRWTLHGKWKGMFAPC